MTARLETLDELLLALHREGLLALQLGRHFGGHDAVSVAERQFGACGQFISAVGGEQFEGAGGQQALFIDLQVARPPACKFPDYPVPDPALP